MLSPLLLKPCLLNTSLSIYKRARLDSTSQASTKVEKTSVYTPRVFDSPRTLKEVSKGSLSICKHLCSPASSEVSICRSPQIMPKAEFIKCTMPAGDTNDGLPKVPSFPFKEDIHLDLPEGILTSTSGNSVGRGDPTIRTKDIQLLTSIPNSGLRFKDYSKIVMQRVFHYKRISTTAQDRCGKPSGSLPKQSRNLQRHFSPSVPH